MKKVFSAPTLTVLGTVASLTQAGTSPNRDTPSGNNDSAFPPPAS